MEATDCEPQIEPVSTDVEASKESLSLRTGFSSEHFKIEINGIPKYFGVKQAKKMMAALHLKPHKVKQCGQGAKYMFVNFPNEEEREKAIAAIDGFVYKGKKLKAFKANAKKDPFIKTLTDNKLASNSNLSPEEALFQSVCLYAGIEYEDQLSKKMTEIEELMSVIRKEVYQQNAFLAKHGVTTDEIAKIEPFVKSPIIDGYRNKCEFSFGKHPITGDVKVGFRLASYKAGSTAVVGPESLPIVSEKMKKIAKKFENFALETGYEPFDFVSQRGYWKQLTVRTTEDGEILVLAILHPQDLSPDQKSDLKRKLIEQFVEKETDAELKVTSLHIQFQGQREKNKKDSQIECIAGTSHITESLTEKKLKFAISPQAFFQINTKCAEKVYEVAGEIAGINPETVVFDVCCGTGTIGICLSPKCKHVYGIDIIPEAIHDARVNAERNNISNATFIAGRAEEALVNLLKRGVGVGDSHVAVVDPPRAGLHNKAINALRSSNVQRLVYISCNAKLAMQNFLNLAQLPSNVYQGDPFIPKKVIPVDLFPHTPLYELIIYFERFPLMKLAQEESNKVD